MLIVIAGLPGSGRSTLAAGIGRALNCAVLGVDQAEAAMWRAGVSQSAPTHHAAYLVVAALSAEQLALGHDVIVDAVNGPGPARAQWRDLAAVPVLPDTVKVRALTGLDTVLTVVLANPPPCCSTGTRSRWCSACGWPAVRTQWSRRADDGRAASCVAAQAGWPSAGFPVPAAHASGQPG